MCAIIGALIWSASPSAVKGANAVLKHIFDASFERGRDGWGYHVHEQPAATTGQNYERKNTERLKPLPDGEFFDAFRLMESAVMIGNTRAEPTTEFVEAKRDYDQQPYRAGKWNIVHNGTIANDKAIRESTARKFVALPTTVDSAAIAELLASEDRAMDVYGCGQYFQMQIAKLKGSYAILATHDDHPDAIFVACNYRPVWYSAATNGCFFASSRDYFPSLLVPQMLEPYSCWLFTPALKHRLDTPDRVTQRALVVCSGGMDSVVAAAYVKANGCDVTLLHFRYGSRAEGPEQEAIRNIAEAMGVDVVFKDIPIYGQDDSPLLRADDRIAGGEAGAEFAHEWVPARNLVMLSIATAYAEARGYDTLVLGNNLEEAGAYPDNEPEFIAKFNDLLPFAIGDGKKLKVIMPVGNFMKHEIVAIGHELEAPLHLTWSCYRAGELHCGTCGPCFMRRTAFEINKLPEVIRYANEGEE